MSKLGQFFKDDYERETLLAPSLALILVPVIVAALLGFNTSILFGFAVLGIEAATVILWLLANTIRDEGRELERRIFSGIFPTTSSLRLRENSDYEVKSRRQRLQQVSGVTLLTKAQELARPNEADQRMTYAINVAKEKMRDTKKFKLLRREVKSYGFWRNMVAIRWWGFGAAAGSGLMAISVALFSPAKMVPTVAACAALLGCGYWLFVVRPRRVHRAAERYKEQYFKSLTLL